MKRRKETKPRRKKNETREQKQMKRDKKILELKTKGLQNVEIAKVVDCSPDTITRSLKRIEEWFGDLPTREDQKSYSEARSEILTAAEMKMLRSMLSGSKMDEAGLASITSAFRAIFQSRRLEEGKSTANVAQEVKFTRVNIDDCRPEDEES